MEQSNIRIYLDDLKVSKDKFLNLICETRISHFIMQQNEIDSNEKSILPYNLVLEKDYVEIILKYSKNLVSILYSYQLGFYVGYYCKEHFILSKFESDISFNNSHYSSIIIQVSNPEILKMVLNRYCASSGTTLKFTEIGKYEVPLYKIEGSLNSILMYYIGRDEIYFTKKFEETSIWPF